MCGQLCAVSSVRSVALVGRKDGRAGASRERFGGVGDTGCAQKATICRDGGQEQLEAHDGPARPRDTHPRSVEMAVRLGASTPRKPPQSAQSAGTPRRCCQPTSATRARVELTQRPKTAKLAVNHAPRGEGCGGSKRRGAEGRTGGCACLYMVESDAAAVPQPPAAFLRPWSGPAAAAARNLRCAEAIPRRGPPSWPRKRFPQGVAGARLSPRTPSTPRQPARPAVMPPSAICEPAAHGVLRPARGVLGVLLQETLDHAPRGSATAPAP